jgi:hypothetical protein
MNNNKPFEEILKEIEEDDSSLLIIQNKFTELSELFQDLCTPYLLITIDEKGVEKFTEPEKIELDDKYNQFKLKIKELICLVKTFLLKSDNSILLDNGFVNHIDVDIYEAIKIFEHLNKTNELRIGKIQNAYSAFTMVGRLFNTSIKIYNDNHNSNKIEQLHNIPDPQFYEINNGSVVTDLISEAPIIK